MAAEKAAATHLTPFAHLGPLVASTKATNETHSGLLLGAAGTLLALVLASGSLLSLGTRALKGQVR